ncbi:cellulose synthase operon protein YhjQ (plasmid) [Cupriavidus pinatubonensis]|uniref:cellulose biosynthesis protein BcsQ n=1 Tax=Cupriavidus pinatubonensis TaxID=248026 RepID=UPI001C72DCA0|nr:cellulose biosynthesis protein BcsQ [Cupriavidus pinatubonensis]QYY34196.1 cellulose synthase operon protein YhjQ [Cupriavidus pinatubonensis]
MKIVAVVSAKGGVGKTTLSANLADMLTQEGERVLAIDLDPQNALRLHFGMPVQDIAGHARATLAGEPWLGSIWAARRALVMPFGSLNEADRSVFERHLTTHPNWLRSQLDLLGLAENDIVIIDTPPGPSPYMRQALSCAHICLTLTLPDAASYATLPLMNDLIRTYCEHRSDFLGQMLVINQVDMARQLGKDVVQILRNQLGERVLGVIHQDQAVPEALAHDRTIIEQSPHSQAGQEIRRYAGWLRQQLQGSPGEAG